MLPQMDFRHLNVFLSSFLRPFLLHCPRFFFDSVLGELLPQVLNFLYEKLRNDWMIVADATQHLPNKHL